MCSQMGMSCWTSLVTELMKALAILAVFSSPSGFLTVNRNVRCVVCSSIGVLQPIIFYLLVASSRSIARTWLAGHSRRPEKRLLIYGAGEAACKPAIAAIANAIYDATGVRLRRVPFRDARVLAALKAANV